MMLRMRKTVAAAVFLILSIILGSRADRKTVGPRGRGPDADVAPAARAPALLTPAPDAAAPREGGVSGALEAARLCPGVRARARDARQAPYTARIDGEALKLK